MLMDTTQTLITVGTLAVGTIITRALPFALFPPNKKTPSYILYLGKVLPYAVMGLLIVFCLKGVSISSFPYGFPEGIAIFCILILHLLMRNVLISIGAGTVIYMILVQHVFL